jgi:hypothetical protein
MSDQLEQNKKTVTAFYDLMFNNNNPREAIERHGEIGSRDDTNSLEQ